MTVGTLFQAYSASETQGPSQSNRSVCQRHVENLTHVFLHIVHRGPLVVVTTLILSVHPDSMIVENRNPNFQYGEVQAAIAVFILVICFIGECQKKHKSMFSFSIQPVLF